MGAFLHMSEFMVPADRGIEAIQELVDQFAGREGRSSVSGLRRSWLLESVDEPGRLVWLAWWDSPMDSQAFLTGLEYARWVSGLRPFLLNGPAWYGYRVLGQWQAGTEM